MVGIRARGGCLGEGPLAFTPFFTGMLEFKQLSGCFIATAAYGSPQEPRIGVLRSLRDAARSRSPLAAAVVDAYERSSPPVAAVLRETEIGRALVRSLLAPVVGALSAEVKSPARVRSPAGAAAAIGLAAAAIVCMALARAEERPGAARKGDNVIARRVDKAVTGGGFQMEGYWVWCPSVVKGDDGLYHLFASRWPKRLPFHPGWLVASEVVHATAKTAEGPYSSATWRCRRAGRSAGTGARRTTRASCATATARCCSTWARPTPSRTSRIPRR